MYDIPFISFCHIHFPSLVRLAFHQEYVSHNLYNYGEIRPTIIFGRERSLLLFPTSIDNSPEEMQMFVFKHQQLDNSSQAIVYLFSNIQQLILHNRDIEFCINDKNPSRTKSTVLTTRILIRIVSHRLNLLGLGYCFWDSSVESRWYILHFIGCILKLIAVVFLKVIESIRDEQMKKIFLGPNMYQAKSGVI